MVHVAPGSVSVGIVEVAAAHVHASRRGGRGCSRSSPPRPKGFIAAFRKDLLAHRWCCGRAGSRRG